MKAITIAIRELETRKANINQAIAVLRGLASVPKAKPVKGATVALELTSAKTRSHHAKKAKPGKVKRVPQDANKVRAVSKKGKTASL